MHGCVISVREPIKTVTEFKYLGQILSADDSDDGAVNMNITKATKTWFRMHRVLSRDTADHHVMGQFYLAVVQAQLLYGSETWVISKCAVKRLESFHNRCARTIAHRPANLSTSGWHLGISPDRRSIEYVWLV
jgi:hypothetical protein